MNQSARYIYEFGSFRLDVAERQLWRDGESVPLTPKAFDLLSEFDERRVELRAAEVVWERRRERQ